MLIGQLDAFIHVSPVVLIDGLTKNFRLPGWRCCWVVGPKDLVTALGSSGSYLDGGASHPTQLAAIPLLDPARVQQDKLALQRCFKEKRDYVLHRLEEMGLKVCPWKGPSEAMTTVCFALLTERMLDLFRSRCRRRQPSTSGWICPPCRVL